MKQNACLQWHFAKPSISQPPERRRRQRRQRFAKQGFIVCIIPHFLIFFNIQKSPCLFFGRGTRFLYILPLWRSRNGVRRGHLPLSIFNTFVRPSTDNFKQLTITCLHAPWWQPVMQAIHSANYFISTRSHSNPPTCRLSCGSKSCKCTSSHRRSSV